jgi:predicted nuclease of predicted toxin-antitoxin system
MRVTVDVNLAPAWADRLRALGHDAEHWSQLGALDAPDSEILAWAEEHNAIVLTCDLDFGAMVASRDVV